MESPCLDVINKCGKCRLNMFFHVGVMGNKLEVDPTKHILEENMRFFEHVQQGPISAIVRR